MIDVVVVVLIYQVRGHRTGSSHSGAEEYPREKHTNKPKVMHAYVTADAIHASTKKK